MYAFSHEDKSAEEVILLAIAGIDIGTTGCKCTVYAVDGSLKSEAYREYHTHTTNEVQTLSPKAIWDNTQEVLKDAAKNAGERIEAVGVTSFGESAVMLDENLEPLTESMLYTDPRGESQCARLMETLGAEYISESTGLNPNPMYTISKLMWLKEHRPELMEKCRHICLYEDYIVYMLSGVHQMDYSLATRTMAFDINHYRWDKRILKAAGIERELLPELVPIGTKAGKIRAQLSASLGVHKDAVIVSCCHDQIAAAVGTGVYKRGMAVDGTGTVECITPVIGPEINRKPLYEGSYAIVPFLEGNFVTYAFSFTGGALLKWYRDKLASEKCRYAQEHGQNPYEYFNQQMQLTEPTGLLVLPYFSGAATPYMDNDAKGAILGLTTDTTSIQIYQALMEGVTYEMKLNVERLAKAGIEIDTIRATGGGATSPAWLQMKADILNLPVISLGAAQSGTLGSIMLAGLACGIYRNMEEAEQIFVKTGLTYYPNKIMHEKYSVLYEKYKRLYKAVKSVL